MGVAVVMGDDGVKGRPWRATMAKSKKAMLCKLCNHGAGSMRLVCFARAGQLLGCCTGGASWVETFGVRRVRPTGAQWPQRRRCRAKLPVARPIGWAGTAGTGSTWFQEV